MNDSKRGISKENLLLIVPPALTYDPSIMALAAADAEALEARLAEIDRARLVSNIDGLDEAVLDILAHDFKVDWWDPEYGLVEKRRTLKTSWQVHKTLGTKAAVETAASAVYPETRVYEWFEYGGEPYHFRLDVDLPEDGWTPERHKRLMWRLQYYKNLRSHLDSVVYRMKPVVLENRQALWFAAMYISMHEKTRQRAALETLLMAMRARQSQQSALALALRSRAAEPFAANLARLLIHVRAHNFGQEIIYLDGRRRLDGTWLLNQGLIRGPALHQLTVWTRARSEPKMSAMVKVRGSAGRTGHIRVGGTYRARGAVQHRVQLPAVSVSTGAANRLSAAVSVTTDNRWMLNGAYRLNGEKKLNAGIRRSEL